MLCNMLKPQQILLEIARGLELIKTRCSQEAFSACKSVTGTYWDDRLTLSSKTSHLVWRHTGELNPGS